MRNFLAFTLAETLIVIGIIGIVSALTLPNLNSSTGEKEKVVKVKKVYQNLTDAFGRSEAVYGPFRDVVAQKKIYSKNFADNTNQFAEVLGERLTEFIKISKNCKSNNKGGCFSNAKGAGYEYLNLSNHTYSFILADGTSVLIVPEAELGGFIMIDIDGPNKGKSTVDRDIFVFQLSALGDFSEIKPYGSPMTCISAIYIYCAPWVIQYDNMDYLKVDAGGICPNSEIMLDPPNVTSCK